MPTLRRLPLFVFTAILTALGCHAQSKVTAGTPLPQSVTHRIEVLLREKAQLPPGSTINIGPAQPSEVSGYNTVTVTFTNEGKTSNPVDFLVSADGKTVAQFIKYDISADPRTLVSAAGRPARGGPPSAPVIIVNFDDLECPFCARLHATIFPAITERYGDKVRIVYRDFPLDQHPWAMRAAVDINCLADQSPAGYWNLVDYIHAHAAEIGAQDAGADSAPARTGEPKSDQPDKTVDHANREPSGRSTPPGSTPASPNRTPPRLRHPGRSASRSASTPRPRSSSTAPRWTAPSPSSSSSPGSTKLSAPKTSPHPQPTSHRPPNPRPSRPQQPNLRPANSPLATSDARLRSTLGRASLRQGTRQGMRRQARKLIRTHRNPADNPRRQNPPCSLSDTSAKPREDHCRALISHCWGTLEVH